MVRSWGDQQINQEKWVEFLFLSTQLISFRMCNFSKPSTLHLLSEQGNTAPYPKVSCSLDNRPDVFCPDDKQMLFFFNRLFLLHSEFQVHSSRVSQKRAKLVNIYTEHSPEAWTKPKPLKWVQTARQFKCSLCHVHLGHDPSASALPCSSQSDNTLHWTPTLHTILPSATRHNFIKKLVESIRCNRQWKC